MVVRSRTGRAVASSAGRESGLVKSIHHVARFGTEGNVHARLVGDAFVRPEVGLGSHAVTEHDETARVLLRDLGTPAMSPSKDAR